ncbi:SemiSWEET family sugar transporter [Nubsella zeaxanthinifaciens]|uniref:SemiSWEET family sugar transporter n=1 Tax=Nubsella zeaxanthinifaciens TaxID=392412 RepID=UPI003D0875C4
MDTKLIIGIGAGVLTAISAMPQIFKALKTKQVAHVSPFMFIILAFGNSAWVFYGILLKDLPIIITNSFSLAMDIIMLLLKLLYHKKDEAEKS